MPIDTSFYPTRQPEPINPLALVQGYAGAAHQIGENKLQQQQIRGRQALGRIISQTTGPNGIPNPPAILAKAAQDPDASWMVLQLQEEAKNANPLTQYIGKNKQGQPVPAQAPLYNVPGIFPDPSQGNNPLTGGQAPGAVNMQSAQTQPEEAPPSQDKIDQAHAYNKAVRDVTEPLINDPDLDHKKAMRGVIDLVAHPDVPHMNAITGAATLSELYGPDGNPLPPEELRAKIQGIHDQHMQHQAHLDEKYPSSEQLAQQRAAQFADSHAQETPGMNAHHQAENPLDLATPGAATGLPIGYQGNLDANQHHYQEVQQAADSVPTENAALNNVLNLSKSGAPTGTVLGEFYSYLAAHNIAPEGAQTDAEKLALIRSHASQLALAAGIPGTNEKLHAIQNAKITDEDLPKVIQGMIPYLKAVNNSKVAQAKYYRGIDPSGSNAQSIAQARNNWQSHMDPRVFELQELQGDPDGLKDFTKGLSKTDRTEILKKYQDAKKLGILEQ